MNRLTVRLEDSEGRTIEAKALAVSPKVTTATDDPEKVVGAANSRYPSTASNVEIASTPEMNDFFRQSSMAKVNSPDRMNFRCVISVNGIPYFVGVARLKTAARSDSPQNIVLDLTEDQGEFWAKVRGLSLRDLDIGTTVINAANILLSWENNYDGGWDVIYCPKVYGKLSGSLSRVPFQLTEGVAFRPDDMRPDVYFPAIVRGIAKSTGYQVQSQFFDTDIFKETVYLFRINDEDIRQAESEAGCTWGGNGMPNQIVPYLEEIQLESWFVDCQTPYGIWEEGRYVATTRHTFKASVKAVGENMVTIIIEKATEAAPDYWLAVQGFNQFVEENTIEGSALISLERGEKIRFICQTSDDTNQSGTNYYDAYIETFTFTGTPSGSTGWALGQTVYTQSLLHDKKVIEFIQGISHQFDLAWMVDPIGKVVYVEPRFDYVLDGVRYPGFYRSEGATLTGDQRSFVISFEDYFGASLSMGYIQEGGKLFDKRNDKDGLPVEGIKFLYPKGSQQKTTTNLNPFFGVLLQGQGLSYPFNIFTYFLPWIVSNDYDPATPLPSLEETKRDGRPLCGLVYRWNATIEYQPSAEENSVQKLAPWAAQYVEQARPNLTALEKPYTISYCNSKAIETELGNLILPGLAEMFWLPFFSTTDSPEELKGAFAITSVWLQNLPFRNIYAVRQPVSYAQWIILQVAGFDPLVASNTQASLLKYRPLLLKEVFRLKHYRFDYLELYPDPCAEIAENVDQREDVSRDIVGIRVKSGWVIPLAYPYVGNGLGEALRLKTDLETFLTEAEVEFTTVTVEAELSIYEKWKVVVGGCKAGFLSLLLSLDDGDASIEVPFVRNCGVTVFGPVEGGDTAFGPFEDADAAFGPTSI